MNKPYSVTTLADRWECSRQHIHNQIKAGVIKNTFKVGKMLRIPAWEIERIEQCGRKNQSSTEEDTTQSAGQGRQLEESHSRRNDWMWQNDDSLIYGDSIKSSQY